MKFFFFPAILLLCLGSCKKQGLNQLVSSNKEQRAMFETSTLETEANKFNQFYSQTFDGHVFVQAGKEKSSSIWRDKIDIYPNQERYNGYGSHAAFYNDHAVDSWVDQAVFEETHQQDVSSYSNVHTTVLINAEGDTVYRDSLIVPVYIDFQLGSASASTIAPGYTLTWNQDPSNSKGVIIEISFSGVGNFGNPELMGSEMVVNRKHVTDDGSYTLTNDLFVGIPVGKNANIQLSIERGSYKVIQSIDGTKKFAWIYSIGQGGTYQYN